MPTQSQIRYVAPFEIQPIPKYVIEELNRRETDYGLNYVNANKTGWGDNGEWNTYKGPMTPWVRICSNGISNEKYGPPIEGFIMNGVHGFYNDYGFNPSNYNKTQTILGFSPSGQEHKITNEYAQTEGVISKHVPPPGVMSVDAVIQKMLYRHITIKWKCHSKDHLNYLTPFFMCPGVSMFIEWGWNHFNPECLLDLTNDGHPSVMKKSTADKTTNISDGDPDDPRKSKGDGLLGIYTDPLMQLERIEKGKGLYELTCGIITSFDYNLQPDGSYECITEVKSNSFIYSGVQTRSNAFALTSPADDKGNKKPEPIKDLRTWIDENFKNLPEVLLNGLNKKEPLFPIEGWPAPETRIFIPRNLKSEKDPRTYDKSVSVYSFDSKGSDDFWISMGLFVDIINKFCAAQGVMNSSFFRIDIQSSWIGGHKNLISTDGKILLIPNSQAPVISPDVQDKGDSSLYRTPKTQKKQEDTQALTEADKTLQSVVGSTARQDLDQVINYFRKNFSNSSGTDLDTEFPSAKYDYFLGKLENLYIHKDLVISAVSKSETVTDILHYVLNKIMESVNGFWKLSLIQYGPSNSLLSIVDTDSINVQRLKQLNSDKQPYLYFFKNRASKNIVQNINFSVKLSDAVATTVLFNQANDDRTTVPMKNPFGFVVRDRFFKKTMDSSYLVTEDGGKRDPKKENKQKQDEMVLKEKDINSSSFIYGEVTEKGTYIRKLALTNKSFLTLLLNDKDIRNTSINNFPQPGIKAELLLGGVAGLSTFYIFGIDNLPEPYDKDVVFQIEDVKHSLQPGVWTTTVTSGIRPLKGLNVKL